MPNEAYAYVVIGRLLHGVSDFMWLRGEIGNVTGLHTGCATAVLTEDLIMQSLTQGTTSLLSLVRIVMRNLVKKKMSARQNGKCVPAGTMMPAWTGGFKAVCRRRASHVRQVPLFKGQRILFKIMDRQDPQILLQGRKPLLVADVWCLENDLQPPTVTSCGVPD